MTPAGDRDASPTLARAFETPASKARHVQQLFATIADRYDLITQLLSFGRDRAWKLRLIQLAGVPSDSAALDLACGTGDIAWMLASRGHAVTGLDITARMIELARAKPLTVGGRPSWLVGDMCALPLRSGRFQLVTTGYGLRNVPDLPLALAEIARVLSPGGRLAVLDFDRPERRWIRAVYLGYLTVVGSALGWVLHGDPDTYRYIPASIRRYPGARAVAGMLREAGFVRVEHVRVLGGLMAIHLADKAGQRS